MRIHFFLLVATVAALETTQAATVPSAARLNINFAFRDNNNELRHKNAGGKTDFAIPEDGYHETIWIEGPFSSTAPCQIVNYERADASIKLVKVISFYNNGWNTIRNTVVTNTWVQPDYATPDFLAALIKAGFYYYCPDVTILYTGFYGQVCQAPIKGSSTAQRQNSLTGGLYLTTANGVTDVSQKWTCGSGTCISKNGQIWKVPDGVTSATRHPAVGTGNVSLTWDMKDYNGILVQKGYYVVWAQLSAERDPPRTLESGTLVNGKEVVYLETCWNDPTYDNIGNHRVVEMFYLGDSGFTKTVYKEKKWSGDAYNYLGSGGMTFNYTTPLSVEKRPQQPMPALSFSVFPNPVGRNGILNIHSSGLNFSRATLYGADGARIKELRLTEQGEAALGGTDGKGRPLASGVYWVRVKAKGRSVAQPLLIGP